MSFNIKDTKAKSAQQIAKEMEKWAKRMNAQKKTGPGITQKLDAQSVSTWLFNGAYWWDGYILLLQKKVFWPEFIYFYHIMFKGDC